MQNIKYNITTVYYEKQPVNKTYFSITGVTLLDICTVEAP